MEYLKLFSSHTNYEEYVGGGGMIRPNVSYCEDVKDVHYNKIYYICKLTLNDGSVIKLYGGNELTREVTTQYYTTCVSAEIEESCTSIGNNAFAGFTSLTSVTIPSSVTSITNSAFASCTGLTSVTIGNGVTTIENGAFERCTSLTSVTIPNSVTSIGASAFNSCSSLTSITIPSSVTSIGSGAFAFCTELTSVDIPSSVTSIIDGAFAGCAGLTSVTIGNSITSIGNSAFGGCTGLTSITIPSSVTSIGYQTFGGCMSLTSITSFATTAPTIQNNTFQNVKSNGMLFLPSNSSGYDTWMQNNAYYLGFYNWEIVTGIKTYYDITDISQPTTICTNYDNSIKSIEIDGVMLDSVVTTYQFNTVGEHVIKYEFNDPTKVGNSAPLFYQLTVLKRAIISNTVTSICANAFNNCSGLTSINIPNSVTSIGNSSFLYCSDLTNVTIGNGVTSIVSQAFYYCTKLSSVTVLATTPPTLGTNALNNNASGRKIYVPQESVEAYKTATDWRIYANDILPIS